MKYVDFYKVLGVPRDASQADIKKAYRKLAHKHHPDVSKSADGDEKFKEVAEAYSTLKDPEKRAAYDALGTRTAGESFVPPRGWQEQFNQQFNQSGQSAQGFDDADLADILAAFASRQHGGGSAGRGPRPRRGSDYEVPLDITLEQIYNGSETDITLDLPEYDGRGFQTGHVNKTFRIRVPKGAADGQRLRLPGKGAPGLQGGPAGDLYVIMQVRPHKLYRVDGRDLHMDLPLTPWEAVLGASVHVPTLGGVVELTIPPGTVAGHKMRLARRGLPDASGHNGDLFAVVRIEVPKKPTARERELLAKLADESTFNPRAHFHTGR